MILLLSVSSIMQTILISVLISLFTSSLVDALKPTQECQGYDCLRDYVFKEDDALEWTLLDHRLDVEDYEGRGGWSAYYINMTSQVGHPSRPRLSITCLTPTSELVDTRGGIKKSVVAHACCCRPQQHQCQGHCHPLDHGRKQQRRLSP